MKLRLLFILTCCLTGLTSTTAQCPDPTFGIIDTFCQGTRYFFGDTIIRDPGFYTQEFVDINNCDSIVNLDLRETPNVTFFIDIDTLAPSCLGDSLGGFMIDVENAVEPIDYGLFEGFFAFNQITLPLANPQRSNVFEDLPFGRYTVVIIDRFGCGGLQNINLTLQALEGPTIIDTLCNGSTLNIGNQVITEAGIYFDTLVGSQGCDSIVTIDLRVPDLNTNIDFDLVGMPPGCMSDSLGSIEISNVSGDAPPFSQFINGESFAGLETDLEAGIYEIIVEDRFLCADSQNIELTPPPQFFDLSISEPQPIQQGESIPVTIQSTAEITGISWNQLPNENCPDCLEFSFSPLRSFDYILTATNIDGCIATDTLSVIVTEGEPLFIPDAIRPDSEFAENRVFTIFGNPLVVESITELFIFDRYGNQVYDRQQVILNDLDTAWNGILNDQFVEQGVYTYRATVQQTNRRPEVISGTFLVLY